jgi:hypothetical protein
MQVIKGFVNASDKDEDFYMTLSDFHRDGQYLDYTINFCIAIRSLHKAPSIHKLSKLINFM